MDEIMNMPDALSKYYDTLTQGLPDRDEHHHGHHHMMDVSRPMEADAFRHKAMKCREELKDKCCKHLIVDIYTKILPLDQDFKDGHHGQCCSDVDKMLAAKGMNGVQYLKSCSDATHAPLVEYLLRSVDTIANEYFREAEEELKTAKENEEKIAEPETPDPEKDEELANQLVDVKKDTEYEDFIERLKKKTINRIVSDVSKIISDKKQEADMTFTTPDEPEESPVGEAVDYIHKKLWNKSIDANEIQDDIIGYAIREATMNHMDNCFRQPEASFREYASRIRLGHGYLITEAAVQELTEKAVNKPNDADNVDKPKAPKIKVFDKVSWQVDNGMDHDVVVNHFTMVFKWLKKHDMLSNDGKEIASAGVDDDTALDEQLVTEEGKTFLTKYYDKIIKEDKYDASQGKKLFDSYYRDFTAKK